VNIIMARHMTSRS